MAMGTSIILCAFTQHRLYRPAQQLDGRTVRVTAVVMDKSNGYAEGMVNANLQLLTVEGAPTDQLVHCPALPECYLGDVITAELAISALPNNSTSWSSFADGCFLEGEYVSDFECIGAHNSLRLTMRRFGQRLSGNIRRYLEPSLGGILAAMTVGDRRFICIPYTFGCSVAPAFRIFWWSAACMYQLCAVWYSPAAAPIAVGWLARGCPFSWRFS